MPIPTENNTFSIQAKVTNEVDGELMLYGDIADRRWYENQNVVVPKEVDTELKKLANVKNLTVRINSYGGSVVAGNAIIAMISAKKKKGCKITTIVEGIAASMGSGIAMVGDEVIMYENAMMMIHKPSSLAWGNADDLAKEIEILNKFEQTLITNYMHHFNGTEDELKQLLADETWLNADEALEKGLCTKIEGEAKVAASAKGFIFNKTEIPSEILDKIKDKIKINDKGGEEDMFSKEEQEKFKALFENGKVVSVTKGTNGNYEIGMVAKNFLSAEQVKAKAGKDMTAEEVLAMFDTVSEQAKKIENFDGEKAKLVDKATAYDTIKENAVKNALKSGVKAKADKFNSGRWTKVLDTFSIDEINAQAKEWEDEAKVVLSAGYHFSNQGNNNQSQEENKELNPEDFRI